ncbi:MAG: APC family permease [Nocardioides sp.]
MTSSPSDPTSGALTPGSGTSGEGVARRDQQRLRTGHLGVLAVAFFVVSAAAPLTGMAGGAPVAMLLGNGPGMPGSYVVVTLLMLVFAVGYVAMARHHAAAGAFYSYVARAMGGHAGGAAAWVALLGYNAMQTGLYGLWGFASAAFMESAFGLTIPWWVMALFAWALIAVLGYRQIDLSLKVLGVLVACEFLIVAAFDLMVLFKGGAGGTAGLSMSPFSLDSFFTGSPAQGLLFAAASFIGFEATTIYSEEAREPARTIPRATYLAVLTIGIFFMITCWLMVNAYGDNATLQDFLVSDDLGGDPTNFLFAMSSSYLGDFLTNYAMLFLFATSLFAALLAFHNAVARYLYALGRDGLVPERLGQTHSVFLSPHMGSVSQSALAAVIIVVFAIAGLDPVLTLFTWLTQLGTLAITYLMAASALAVFVFFRRNPGLERSPWRSAAAPLISFAGLLALSIFATTKFSFLIGDPESVLGWLLPALVPVAMVVGWVSAQLLRTREPDAYAQIGRNRAVQLTEEANQ